MTALISKCEKCKPHKFQDETYGVNMRVFNRMGKKQGTKTQWRCTVCLAIKEFQPSNEKSKNDETNQSKEKK
jgi:hypothetical protein